MSIREKLLRLTDLCSVAAVARRAGIHHDSLRAILKGRYKPGREAVLRLSRTLGVDPGWLMDDSKPWPPVRVEVAETQAAA